MSGDTNWWMSTRAPSLDHCSITIGTACCSGIGCLGLTRSPRRELRKPCQMSFILSARAAINVFCESDQVFAGPNSSKMTEKRKIFSEIHPAGSISEVATSVFDPADLSPSLLGEEGRAGPLR